MHVHFCVNAFIFKIAYPVCKVVDTLSGNTTRSLTKYENNMTGGNRQSMQTSRDSFVLKYSLSAASALVAETGE